MRNYILSCLLISITLSCSPPPKLIKLSGPVFGTGYNIRYYDKDNTNYQVQFDSLFKVINQSMSTYIPDSDISRINRNETITVDNHFKTVFKASQLIYEETNGAFDPTIGSVVNAWDFGPEGKIEQLDSLKIKSLMTTVGFNKVML
ncbi:MAG: FAD:protein FMN transferase, partial [Winogradskyella sp.]|nr:FAD:protein FMN transferase [Winogradskyella sp.]